MNPEFWDKNGLRLQKLTPDQYVWFTSIASTENLRDSIHEVALKLAELASKRELRDEP